MSSDGGDESQTTFEQFQTNQNTTETVENEYNDNQNTPYTTNRTQLYLNQRQNVLLDQKFGNFHRWMCTVGKDPNNNDGLSETTADNYLSRIDQLFRVMWTEFASDIQLTFPQTIADDVCEALKNDELTGNDGEYSESHKRKLNDTLQKYFEWQARTREKKSWSPPYTFNDGPHRSPDSLTMDERRRMREAVLTFDTIPTYSDCSTEQRDRIKTYLAQRLEKPKTAVTPADWKQHNRRWKIPSLVWTSLDAGLRPIEVNRSNTTWPRLEKMSLHIPKEESAKNRDHWEVALRPDTVEALSRWMTQREHLSKYDDTDSLWLTRESNPWSSDSLNGLFDRLCEAAEIDRTNRRLSWYSIRHSVGDYMTEEGDLGQTKEQLRHKSLESTLQYRSPSIENRQSTLEKMG